jgi:hypothetical protein
VRVCGCQGGGQGGGICRLRLGGSGRGSRVDLWWRIFGQQDEAIRIALRMRLSLCFAGLDSRSLWAAAQGALRAEAAVVSLQMCAAVESEEFVREQHGGSVGGARQRCWGV